MQKSHFCDTILPLIHYVIATLPLPQICSFWLPYLHGFLTLTNGTINVRARLRFFQINNCHSRLFSVFLSLFFCPSVSFSLIHSFLSSLFFSLSLHFSLCLPGAAFQRVCTECYLHHYVCSGHGRVLYANGFYWFTTDGKCDPYLNVRVCVSF